MADPQIYIFFSDDTRDEIGNKTSIMGMLGPDMNITTNSPDDVPLTIGFTVGALCRFFDPGPVETTFQINFHNASEKAQSISPPPPTNFVMSAPNGEDEWTSQVVGSFNAFPVHDGMRIEAVMRAHDKEYVGNLKINIHRTSSTAEA